MTLGGDRSDGFEALRAWARENPLAVVVLTFVFICLAFSGALQDLFPPAPVRPAALGDEDGARGAALVVIHQSALLADYALPEVPGPTA